MHGAASFVERLDGCEHSIDHLYFQCIGDSESDSNSFVTTSSQKGGKIANYNWHVHTQEINIFCIGTW